MSCWIPAAHRYNMSTTRGLGPVRQSEPLAFARVAELGLANAYDKSTMPANPSSVVTLGTFYSLRELEMAAAKVSDIMLINKDMEVRLRLSLSKNDPAAKGTERPWRCVCEEANGTFAHRFCPYHAAVHHLKFLKKRFPDLIDDPDFPCSLIKLATSSWAIPWSSSSSWLHLYWACPYWISTGIRNSGSIASGQLGQFTWLRWGWIFLRSSSLDVGSVEWYSTTVD